MPASKRSAAIDIALIVLLTAVLIAPVFRMEFSDRWSSIESTFIADARFLHDHWVHPNWQPLWYCGTRTDYVYPPGLRYGTAGLAKLLGVSTARSYHLYIGIMYLVGMAGVYFFVRTASGSRSAAWLATAAVALLSPAFLFLPQYLKDAGYLEPVRYGVLVKYGEGPHISSLAWIPIALAFAWRALPRFHPMYTIAAAVASMLVVANNFYGATALAMMFPVVVWSYFVTSLDWRVFLRAAVIAVLAYGLTAFWLVPSFITVTLRNMQYVSNPGNPWSVAIAVSVAVLYVAGTYLLAARRPERTYAVFVSGALLFFALNVLGLHYFGFRIIGEPHRHIPEFDMLFIFAAAELVRRAWRRRKLRYAAAVLVLLAFVPSKRYVRHAWDLYRPDPNPSARVEYQLAHWMAEHMPNSRAFVTGSVRFWYNTWHDLQQVGGGSEQGILNGISVPASWEMVLGPDGEIARMWLQVLGADAIIVNGPKSAEIYHDQKHPYKYKGLLPVLHDNGRDDVIYGVPRRYPALARVVDTAKLEALGPVVGNGTRESLGPIVDVLEHGPNAPTTMRWIDPEQFEVMARIGEGHTLVIQESWDKTWRAYSEGREFPVRPTTLGFMRVDAPPGRHTVRLVHDTPTENIAGAWMTGITLAVIAAMAGTAVRRRHRLS